MIKGQIYFEQERWQDAISSFRYALSLKENDIVAKYYLAMSYYYQKEYHFAEPLLKEMCEQKQNDLDILEALVQIYIHYEKQDKAHEIAKDLVRLAPENARFWFFKGITSSENDREDFLLKAISLDKKLDAAYVELAKLYWQENLCEKAIILLQNCIMISSHNPQPGILLANYLLVQKEYEKSFATSIDLLKRYPQNRKEIMPVYLTILIAQKKFSEAFSLLKEIEPSKGIEIDPRITYINGVLQVIHCEYSSGLNNLLSFRRVYPRFIDTYYYLAMAYHRSSKTELAIHELYYALKIEKNNRNILQYLLEILVDEKSWQKALEICELYLDFFPEDLKIKNIHIQILLQLEQTSTAYELYDKDIKNTTLSLWLQFTMGEENAIAELENRSNEDAKAYYFLAQAYLVKNNFRAVIKNIQIFLSLYPQDVEGRLLLAQILEKQGAFNEAGKIYESLHKDFPDHKQIRVKLWQNQLFTKENILIPTELLDIKEFCGYLSTMNVANISSNNRVLIIKYLKNLPDKTFEQLFLLGKLYFVDEKYEDAEKNLFYAHVSKSDIKTTILFALAKKYTGKLLEAINLLENYENKDKEIKTFLAILYMMNNDLEKMHMLLKTEKEIFDSWLVTGYYIWDNQFDRALETVKSSDIVFSEKLQWMKLIETRENIAVDILFLRQLRKYFPLEWILKQLPIQEQSNSFTVYIITEMHSQIKNSDIAIGIMEKQQDKNVFAFSLASNYIQKKEWSKAFSLLQELTSFSKSHEVELLWATFYSRQKKYDRAQAYYASALALADQENIKLDGSFYNNFAWAILHSSNDSPQKALEYAQQALLLLPNNPEVWDTLGWSYASTKNYNDAIDLLEKALFLLKQNPTILYHLGFCYYHSKQKEKAEVFLQQACLFDFPERILAQKILNKIENKNE